MHYLGSKRRYFKNFVLTTEVFVLLRNWNARSEQLHCSGPNFECLFVSVMILTLEREKETHQKEL